MTRSARVFSAAMEQVPIVAIVRLRDARDCVPLAHALHRGGIRLMEIALTTDGALGGMAAIKAERLPDMAVGIGSVRHPDEAMQALQAGADYLVTPTLHTAVVDSARSAGTPVICGALSPTELDTAHRAGADHVKLFPASAVGPSYVREVLAPMPDLRIMPTGGVDVSNIADYRAAGAVGVGVGSALVGPEQADAGDWAMVEHAAAQLVTTWHGASARADAADVAQAR